MASDLSETVRNALGNAARDALKNVSSAAPTGKNGTAARLSGAKGLAAGAGLAAAVPLAKKGVDAVRGGGLPKPSPARAASKVASKAGDKVGENLKDAVTSKVDEAGGAGGLVKEAASGLLPGLGGDSDGGGKGGMPGVGKGRRMPVQQSVDVAVPLETAYNQWTQFEDWPEFMHRVTRATQDDDCSVNFATKIWGKTKEFTADIETQRPDERIKWRVSQGITHTGVVTFHELAPRLTRIELSMDVDPGSLIEKAARGMRHVKRAARADLHRFKAFIEMQEQETGAWRGVIEDGELVEEHDPSYDEEREYSDIEELKDEASPSPRIRTRTSRRRSRRTRIAPRSASPPGRAAAPRRRRVWTRRGRARPARARRASAVARAAPMTARRARVAARAAPPTARPASRAGSRRRSRSRSRARPSRRGPAVRATASPRRGRARARQAAARRPAGARYVSGALKSAIVKRAGGDKPSALHAAAAALVAAAAAAVITYRLMRS